MPDDEREQISTRLNAAFEAGSLDVDDYRARLDRLFAAQTLGELVPVVGGLPPVQTHTPPAIVEGPPGAPGELAEARSGAGLTVVTVSVLAGVLLLVAILLIILL